MGYVEDIKAAIGEYREIVKPLLDEGAYETAGMELRNAIVTIESALREIPNSKPRLKMYAVILKSRFDLLEKDCLEHVGSHGIETAKK